MSQSCLEGLLLSSLKSRSSSLISLYQQNEPNTLVATSSAKPGKLSRNNNMLRSFKFLLLALVCDRGASFLSTNSLSGTPRTNLVELQAVATQTKDVGSLLASNRQIVDSLASVSEDVSEITRLRFAMGFDTPSEAEHALRKALSYRKGDGKSIVDAAQEAYETASIGGGWDNEVVRNSAPHASLINKYITSNNIVTVSTSSGDLVYVIRASLIDDKKMMDNVSVQQLSDFFMYVKEIHSLVANQRSETSGRLCEVILANDITGVRKAPDSRFSKALSSSSSQYDKLYPTLAGPTMILNLPFILQAFVALFKPLFPKTVQAKLKFTKAPVLGSMSELTPLASRSSTKNQLFMKEIDNLLKK